MSNVAKPQEQPQAVVKVKAKDLLGHGVVACPNPNMPLWCNHPKVYLDVARTGEATCPYCGTHYVLEGSPPKGH